MSDNVSYTLNKNEEGNFVVTSKVKSFNLDHVTEKDVVSFYKKFSQTASFDTGLLPVSGNGILSIRTAGFDTQVAIQHSPGLYHINWGDHEGDSSAKTYYVAQPYRIVIGDFREGNLLGARTFYSPVPITSPDNILYHVNLPNINCKGYRGNGVGWICLYHKEDWSSLPFNEKVNRLIERCSGVETYNDANMSETDGPRFYSSKQKPMYFTDPYLWEKKTAEDGYLWTMDPDLLIPVLVKDIDNQDKHYDDGQPLTFSMAILGSYSAYYSDSYVPKMYNIMSRPDLQPDNNAIATFINRSFSLSYKDYSHQESDDPYSFTVSHRQKNGSEVFQPSLFHEDTYKCDSCDGEYDSEHNLHSVSSEEKVCQDCLDEYYVYIESTEEYYHYDHDKVVNVGGDWYHTEFDTIISCAACSELYAFSSTGSYTMTQVYKELQPFVNQDDIEYYCKQCFIDTIVPANDLTISTCFSCDNTVVPSWSSIYQTRKAMVPNSDGTSMVPSDVTFCLVCSHKYHVCACGLVQDKYNNQYSECAPCEVNSGNSNIKLTVNKCCASCLYIDTDKDNNFIPIFKPFSEEIFNNSIEAGIYYSTSFIEVNDDDIF